MKRLSTKKLLSAIGLLVFPFCLSGTAEAGEFVCTRPASYYYNCGNKEFPQANFCPSDYQRECGSFSQRQRRVNEVKRSAARAPKREEPIEDSEPIVPEIPVKKPPVAARTPKAPDVADKDVVEPVAPNEPAAKTPAKVADKAKQDEEDGLGDGLVPPAAKPPPVATEPAAESPDKVVAEKPAQDPAAKPAQDQAAAKPTVKKPVIEPGTSVCSESVKEILSGKSPKHNEEQMKVLRAKLESIIGEPVKASTKSYNLKAASGKTCKEDKDFLPPMTVYGFVSIGKNATYAANCLENGETEPIKPATISIEGDRMTVKRGRFISEISKDATGKFGVRFCTDGKKATILLTAIGASIPSTITGGKVTMNFTPDARGGHEFEIVSSRQNRKIGTGYVAAKPGTQASREVASLDEAQ